MAAVHAASLSLKQTSLIGVGMGGGGGVGGGGSCGGMVKDSRWLTLEVCREYARNKCTRTEDECRFAHPPGNVEVQNGRVMCCFDSIKGRCQRTEPPCKYLHPPQHLKEQLLQNGRNNLLMRHQLHWQTSAAAAISNGLHPTIVPTIYPLVQGLPTHGYIIHNATAAYSPYFPPPNTNTLLPITSADQSPSSSSLPMSLPALTSSSEQQQQQQQQQQLPVSSSASNGCSISDSTDLSCTSNGMTSSCTVIANGHPHSQPPQQHYWPAPATTTLSSTYLVDGIPTGTTYYSPTAGAYFQGVSASGTGGSGATMVLKTPPPTILQQQPQQCGSMKANGVTLYAACTAGAGGTGGSQYPLSITSVQSCYHPINHMGMPGASFPHGLLATAVAGQRY